MKKFFLSFVLAVASLAVQAQDYFVIEGQIKNAPKNAVVHLIRYEGMVLERLAKDTITNDSFSFREKTTGSGTEKLALVAENNGTGGMILNIWACPGSRVKVSSDNMFAYTWDVESDIPEQITRQKFLAPVRDLWIDAQRIDVQEDSIKARLKAKGLSDSEKSRLKATRDSLKKAKQNIQDEIILKKSKTMAAMQVDDSWMLEFLNNAYMAKRSEREDVKNCVKELYDKLPEKWRNTPHGKEAGNVIYPPSQFKKGDIVDGFDLYDLNGNVHKFSDFRGKYILMDFWSYGCGACLMAIPELKEVAETYKDSIEVISMSIDNDKMWREATEKYGVTGNNLNDRKGRTGIAAKFGIYGIPLFVLISPQGTFIEKWQGYAKGGLKERVAKQLAK